MDLTVMNTNNRTDILTLSQKEDEKLHYVMVDFIGELDSSSLPKAKEFVNQVLSNFNQNYLLFNFTNLKYINSESIGFVLQIYEKLDTAGKKLVVLGAKKNVFDVLSVIGMFDTVAHFNSLLDFIKSL